MDYKDRWHAIEELGAGGQGKVYTVYDKREFDIENKISPATVDSIRTLGSGIFTQESREEAVETFRKIVVDFIRMEDPKNQGALKVLHEPEDARDSELAEARIKKEIEAMSRVSHPNLLWIVDYDLDGKWFVSEFHPKGTLIKNKGRFTGNFISSLRAFRPLVEGVSELHKNGLVHRDIKPQNVFLDLDNNLVLGDFGLVFFVDEAHTRISRTWENVGSRDWMPGWAMGKSLIEDTRPTFDVFCLGKLLWAMVSNIPILQLWYFDQPEFNLEKMFPNAPYINLANAFFKKCIVQYKKDCVPDATALLEEIDKVLTIIDRNADLIDENIERPCRVCGIGKYRLVVNVNKSIELRNFGMNAVSGQSFKIFACNHCGHVQMFSFADRQTPPAWSA